MSRANPFQRFVGLVHERGVRGLWFAAVAELGYRRMFVREFVLDEGIPDVTPGIAVTFEPLQHAHLDEYNAFRESVDPHSARRRMDGGHHCVIARHDGGIVCACWAATGTAWSAYLSTSIALAPGEVYLYDMFTRPDVRRLGVAEALRVEVCRSCRAQGVWRVISYMVPENANAMSRGLGFRNIGRIGCIRIAGLRYDFVRMFPGAIAPGVPSPASTTASSVA